MTRPLVATLLVLGAASAVAAPVPTHLLPKDVPYWPTEVGTKWVYLQGGAERPEEITQSEQRDGATRITVPVGAKGELDVTYDVSKDGVIRRTCGQFTTDFTMLRFPLKAGDAWDFACPIQKGLLAESGKVTVGEIEEVAVPAGKYRATKVVVTVATVDGQAVAQPYTYTYWFAQGVGLVRLEYQGGEKVLKSFTPVRK